VDTLSQWSQKLDAYLAMTKLSKKQLALELGISINTFGKWWGRREPSPEHVTKIRQLLHEDTSTTIRIPSKNSASLGRETDIVGKVTEEKHADEANFQECCEAPQSNRVATDTAAGLASDEGVARQLPRELSKKGERYEDRAAVISLLRTTCPFCEHGVKRFQNCLYCGQHFVWANVPVDKSV
jgi:transcriptional regulator with XRE-family HTH domain